MAMPERAGRDASAEIQIFTTIFIPHAGSFSLREGKRESSVSLENILAVFFDGGHKFLGWIVVRLFVFLEALE